MKIKNYQFQLLFVLTLLFLNAPMYAQTIDNTYATQINSTFSGVDKNKIPHKLLLDYAMEFTALSAYNGVLAADNVVHKGALVSIYNTLLMAKVKTDVPNLVSPAIFNSNWDNLRQKNKIVLSGLYYKYSKFKNNAYPNYITLNNNKLYDKYVNGVWQNPYETRQVFAIAPPIHRYKNLNLDVELPNSLWYTNQTNTIQSIAIDFGDSNGYQSMIFGQVKSVSYTQKGLYEWKYKLTLSNNEILYSHSKIYIDAELPPNNNQNSAKRTINQTCSVNGFGIDQVEFSGIQTYLGEANTATLEIDYRAGNDCNLTRPLIVAEGFDSGLMGLENGLGDVDYNDFRQEALFFSGNLAGEITDYDIIYVNWNMGNDYIQRNALLLEDIITWVNSIKTGNTPNVVLGQSMGGVIARYALADMEQRSNLTHDTSLYISHDAPHQGANIPLGIQYFARHILDIVVDTPLGDNTIKPSAGSAAISPEDIEGLLNAAGTKQLLINSVNSNFEIDNTMHDAWQADLRSKGYPQLTRNIAISNGSHCANTQNYNPSDVLMSLSGSGKTTLLTDIIAQLFEPISSISSDVLADFFDDAALFFLGRAPGSSKFDLDFTARALPYTGQDTQIYHGKIVFTKKVFWIDTITHTVTEEQYNNPSDILSYDYYPGGAYNNFFNFNGATSNNDFFPYNFTTNITDTFNFIPTPSALDVGSGITHLTDEDYLKVYTAANPPSGAKSIPFANFTTSHQPNTGANEEHISFNVRNGNWLATEINSNPNDQDIFDCTVFCSDTGGIAGDNYLCTTGTYTVTDESTISNWWITDPNNLVTFVDENGTEAIVNQADPNTRGYFTLNVIYGTPKCGTTRMSKENIWVGKPNVPNRTVSGGQSNVGINGYSQLSVDWAEGNTHFYWWIYTVNSSCNGTLPVNKHKPKFYGSNTDTYTSTSNYDRSVDIDWGNCTGTYVINCIAVNDCGSSAVGHKIVTVSDGSGGNPCDPNYYMSKVNTGANHYKIRQENPCDPNNSDLDYISNAKLYNAYGVPEQGITHQGNNVELNNVQSGTIKIIKVVIDNEVIIKRIITD